jgi:hypothetical protein
MSLSVPFKRLIFVFTILAIVAYLVTSYLERIAKEKTEREGRETIERSVTSAVDKMVSQYNAVSDWREQLSQRQSSGTEKILGVQLERLWLVQRPILFIGSIEEISTMDGQTYRVRIQSHRSNALSHLFLTRLGLELKCTQTMLDSFLEAHPNLFSGSGPGPKNGVAVIAKIGQIKTHVILGKEAREELRMGVGDCLDMTYTGDVQF